MTRSFLLDATLVAIALSLGAVGCDRDDTGETDGTDTDTDADNTFTVRVITGWTPGDAVPLEGATVAVDDGNGVRTEQVTDSDGEAVFDLDWSLGPVDVTVDPGESISSTERVLKSFLGVEEDSREMLLYVTSALNEPDFVRITGMATPRSFPKGELIVFSDNTPGMSTSRDSMVYQGHGSSFSLDVVPGSDLRLLAVEFEYTWLGNGRGEFLQPFSGWTVVEHEAVTQDTVIDIDLSDPEDPAVISGRFVIPESDALIEEGSWGYVNVLDGWPWEEGCSVGFPSWMARTKDNSAYEFTAEHAPIREGSDVGVLVQAQSADWSTMAVSVLQGFPADWTSDPVLPAIPSFAELPDDWPTDRTFAFTPSEDTSGFRCVVLRNSMERTLWIACHVSSDSFAVPEPPSSAEPARLENISKAKPQYIVTTDFLQHYTAGSTGPNVALSRARD